jgi:hypothetical protein
MMPKNCGVNDPRHRSARRRTFSERLGKGVALQKIREASQKFSDPDLRAMEVGDTFQKIRPGEDTSEEEEPHERSAFLHEVDHGGPL